jgi:DUF1680 family protein
MKGTQQYKELLLRAVLLMSIPNILPAKDVCPCHLTAVQFTDVKLTDEFWAPRLENNRIKSIPHIIKKCGGGENSDTTKLLEGIAYSLSNHPDPVLEKKADEIVTKIAATQRDDGYLFPLGQDDRWKNLAWSHELYNAGHLFEAALAYYQATGKDKFLKVAYKLADHIDSVFGPDKLRDIPGHEEIELALVKLYKATGERRYLKLAKFFLDERGHYRDRKLYAVYAAGSNEPVIEYYHQDHKPVIEQTEAVGHAVRAVYLYIGMTDVGSLTGENSYLKSIDRIWKNLVASKLYITGSIGARHEGESFGDNYELPNKTAHNETCAAIALALWSHRLNLLYADASYMDVFERTLYNGLLSGVSLDGEKFFYCNPLESEHGTITRQSWFDCACCPTNMVRFLPALGGSVYANDNNGIYVNLYIAGTAKVTMENCTVKLTQQTRYPWDGKVNLTIEPDKTAEFAVNLRIPGWCTGRPVPSELYSFVDEPGKGQDNVSLKVNGKTVAKLDMQKGYARIHRRWERGDTIQLEMPMPVRRVKSHPKVGANEGRVALQRGPIVYCMEEVDNGENLRQIYLPDDSRLTAKYRSDMLGGMVVVEGRAMVRKQGEQQNIEENNFLAVPYYSWNNRGAGQMVVWIPTKAK